MSEVDSEQFFYSTYQSSIYTVWHLKLDHLGWIKLKPDTKLTRKVELIPLNYSCLTEDPLKNNILFYFILCRTIHHHPKML